MSVEVRSAGEMLFDVERHLLMDVPGDAAAQLLRGCRPLGVCYTSAFATRSSPTRLRREVLALGDLSGRRAERCRGVGKG